MKQKKYKARNLLDEDYIPLLALLYQDDIREYDRDVVDLLIYSIVFDDFGTFSVKLRDTETKFIDKLNSKIDIQNKYVAEDCVKASKRVYGEDFPLPKANYSKITLNDLRPNLKADKRLLLDSNSIEQSIKTGQGVKSIQQVFFEGKSRYSAMGENFTLDIRKLDVRHNGYSSDVFAEQIASEVADRIRIPYFEGIAEEINADGYTLTAHFDSAPDHQPVQGHTLDMANFDLMQSGEDFVDIDGNHYDGFDRPYEAYNCRHLCLPVRLETFKPIYTDEELAKMGAGSNYRYRVKQAHKLKARKMREKAFKNDNLRTFKELTR